jgi:predicted RNA binding protein with dsRBD fold (UPF0201 family)
MNDPVRFTDPEPVDLIEPAVSRLYKRTMFRAETEHRLLNASEETSLAALSAAVSLRRIADALRILVVVLAIGLLLAALA